MTHKRKPILLLVAFVVLMAVLSCSLIKRPSEELPQPTASPTVTPMGEAEYPTGGLVVGEPGGAELSVAAGALSEDVKVSLEDIGEGQPFAAGSPLSSASAEYFVDLGGARQVGEILLTVPAEGGAKEAQVNQAQAYMVWTEPSDGTPSVVGAHVAEDKITFPVVGEGKYQVFQLLAHEALVNLVTIYDPLAVPTYQQRTPAWCSPTAMTNVVNYHQGSWLVGGFGAVWGESSNWYLAGKAGQPFNKGYFFHWLLGAGGYTVPSDVKQSFSDGNVEVIIWNWNAATSFGLNPANMNFEIFTNYDYAEDLFDAFQAYVEHFVWGVEGPRRPVAWGSSLAGHSRTITGSNGTEYYFNNPSDGSLNDSKAWSAYRQEVMDSLTAEKTEVIDTVIFYAEPRPAAARRGVIWLYPGTDNGFPGSVTLLDGENGSPSTKWYWDGAYGHENGYYYDDLRGVLPSDPVFDYQFKALNFQDAVEYGFGVFNITEISHSYHVDVIFQNENLSVLENVGKFDVTVPAGTRVDQNPAESFPLYGLPPGLYTLKFVLLQNGVYQDVKYVQFRVAESDLMLVVPSAILTKNAFCRKGPDPVFEDVTAFEAGTELELLGYNPDRTWGKFSKTINDILVQCWISLSAVEVTGGEDAPILVVPPLQTEEPGPVCERTLSRTECGEAGGTYIAGVDSPYCSCPE